MTYVGLYAGTVNPRLIATSDDPDLVAEVAQRILGRTGEQDPDPAVKQFELGRRAALKEISRRPRPRLTIVSNR